MGRRRGIGPVHIMMFGGFAIGLMITFTKSANGNGLIQIIGILALGMGLFGMVGRTPIKGPLGGVITGFGLGATFGSLIWP